MNESLRPSNLPPRISVIIPTFRRPELLTQCLRALVTQRRLPDEVVVVCRPDDEPSRVVVRNMADTFPKAGLHEALVSRNGLEAALNAGLEKVAGEIICFSDDDAEVFPDWLQKIESHFASNPSVGGVGGRDIPVVDGEPLEGTCRMVAHLTWFGRMIGNSHLELVPSRVIEVDGLKGVNMSFRARYLEGFRFDERCVSGGTTSNDLDVSLFVRRRGGKLIYDPEVRVNHYSAPRSYGVGRGAQWDRYCYSHNLVYVLLKHLSWPKKIIMLGYYFLFGQRKSWGVATLVLDPLLRRRIAWRGELGPSFRGKFDAMQTYFQWRREQTLKRVPTP